MAQTLSRIGCQVIDILELFLSEDLFHEFFICKRTSYKLNMIMFW